MIDFERLAETARRLITCLREGGIQALDDTLAASRITFASYRYTYDPYVQYFRERRGHELTEQDLFVGFAFAYSWMATIKQLDPALATVRSAVLALNQVHSWEPAELGAADEDAQAAERLVNSIDPVRHFLGSVVATSKLLHFVNPQVFPIWDAVIHRYCRVLEPTGADSLKTYAEYTFGVHQLTHHPNFELEIYEPLLHAMQQAYASIGDQYRLPEPMGKLRAAEFVMFYGGKAESADGRATLS